MYNYKIIKMIINVKNKINKMLELNSEYIQWLNENADITAEGQNSD